MGTMSFEEAVKYVIENDAAAFAFVPEKKKDTAIGGEIWAITRGDTNQEDPDEFGEYTVDYVGGRFNSSSGEADSYPPEYTPDKAKKLQYEVSSSDVEEIRSSLDCELQIVLKVLRGQSLEDARNED